MPLPLDVRAAFGPLASMHAALDEAGCGTPCAVTARFDGVTAHDLERHLLAAAGRFPVLAARLAWRGGRPLLEPGSGTPLAPDAPLTFRAEGAPLAWRAAIAADPRGATLTAVFAHAIADGHSMLRLIAEIEHRLDPTLTPTRFRARGVPRPAARAWLPGFLVERMRPHLVLAPDGVGAIGASWFRADPGERDRMIARARAASGRVLPFVAAAAALAAADVSPGRGRRVFLNIPVLRSDRPERHGAGFGFGAGSLLIAHDLPRAIDTATLAARLAPRLAAMIADGWDAGLEWFVGSDPRRHRRFARIRARASADPAINVSWKRFDPALGGIARDIACFAAAPTAHVSAHADAGGLSVSVTAPRSRAVREAFLTALARRLGIAGALAPRTYPEGANCSAASSA